jgi:RNA polymerase sigma factor (sigma-70 family)
MSEAALRGLGNPRAGALRLASDARLVRIAVRGERRAFAAIFQRYHQELYRYCNAILGNEDEAGDALQNTMVKVMRALPGESREIALRPWLYRIAHNEAIALLRQRTPVTELSEEAPASSAAQPEHRLEASERLRQLTADLRSLPERQRGALVMRELNEMEYAGIGAVFGTSADAARQTVYEARVALQELAEGRAMSCDAVRQALSADDGRVLRGRRLRAHLRSCEGCRNFRAGIRRRKADLAALAPPLPALAAAGLLHGLLGSGPGGAAGAGLAGSLGGAGKLAAGSTVMKSAAAVVATATLAVGVGDLTGVVHPPLIGGSGNSAPTSGPAELGRPAGSSQAAGQSATPDGDSEAAGGRTGKHNGEAADKKHGVEGNGHGHGNGHGNGAAAQGQALAHPQGPPSGPGGHSDFGKSHAPALPAPALSHPASPPASAKPSHPSSSSHQGHALPPAATTKPATPTPPAPASDPGHGDT